MLDDNEYVQEIKEKLFLEYENREIKGIYTFLQENLAYNSNKIEGSNLTLNQVVSIFEKGLIPFQENVSIKNKDIEELTGHFKMFDYALSKLNEPLSEDIIKTMHYHLKVNVFEDLANGFVAGEYKKLANCVSDAKTALPIEVPDKIRILLRNYHCIENKTIEDIAKLHADFEIIHPFQDGNGRVGRMIVFKECLKYNIVPVLIRENRRYIYYQCLQKAQSNDYSDLVNFFKEEQLYCLKDKFF